MPSMMKIDKDAKIKIVCFRVGDEDLGIEVSKIIEIVYYNKIIPIPKAPAFIEGLFELRGNIIPVIELKKRLEMRSNSEIKASHILIAKIKGKIIGLLVDQVDEVAEVSSDKIQSPQNIISREISECLNGVCKVKDKLILLLNMESLLNHEENMMISNISSISKVA